MLVGIGINSISGENKNRSDVKEINVNSSPTIENIETRNMPGIGTVLIVEFKFETKYEPGIGIITIKGSLMYKVRDPVKISEEWKNSKRLPKDVAIDILNNIFRFSLTKIVGYSNDLRLPPPIKFPVVKSAEEYTKK